MPNTRCNLIIDSCCDLPRDVIDQEGIELLQFPYTLDNEELLDDMFESVSSRDFYGKMRKGAECSTAQIQYLVLDSAFKRAIESGVPTVYLAFTSGLSGTYETAVNILTQLKAESPQAEVYVVDTRLASIAEGMLVCEAICQRSKGLSAQEMVEWASEARFFVNESFTLESLEWLKKGGRIPASIAFAGSKLDVKPVLDITTDGTLALSGVARGRKKGLRQLVDFYEANAPSIGEGSQVIVGNADCPKDAEKVKEMLLKVDPSLLFLDTSIGPVIGSHVGPGMLAISFFGQDKRERLSVSDRIAKKIRKGASETAAD